MAASERTRQEERRRRADIAAQLEEAVKLNEALKMNDAETNKTRSQKEVEWQERLSSLEQQLMEAKRDGEVCGRVIPGSNGTFYTKCADSSGQLQRVHQVRLDAERWRLFNSRE